MEIYSDENVKGIDLLRDGSESKLLEVQYQANLSDRELDEMPFGVSSSFSRFFECSLLENKKGIYFACNEVGGCFCESAYVLELNSWPEDSLIEEISQMLKKLDSINARVQNLQGALSKIYYKLDVKKLLIDEFQREELEDSLIYELRTNIRDSINLAIDNFRDKYSSTVAEKDLKRIIDDIRREFN